MHSPLHHYIRPGLIHFMAFPETSNGEGPIVPTLKRLLQDTYFDIVEVGWIKDPVARAEVRSLFASAGVKLFYGAHPRLLSQRLDLNNLAEPVRLRAVQEMHVAVDEAAELGAQYLTLLSGCDVAVAHRATAMDALEKSLLDICAHAAGRGLTVVLEVFDRDIDKKCLIGPAQMAREIAERVKAVRDNFGLAVDLSHIPLLDESPDEALIPVRDHLIHAHIGNCVMQNRNDPAWGDRHPRFGYPGGANDVPEIAAFIKVLFEIGYLSRDGSARGTLSFEIKPLPGEDSWAMIAGAKRKLNEAWDLLSL